MTAGAIPAPSVVPLRPPVLGKAKGLIDNQTRVELRCDSSDAADIYFTIDGSAPDPFQPIGGGRRSTYVYEQPVVLPPGKVVLKAMAVAHDGRRASSIVAKQFQVESSGPPPPDALTVTPPTPPRRPPSSARSASDNETAFLEDMKRLQAAKARSTNATRSMIRKLLAAQRESDETLIAASQGGGGGGGGSGRKSILKNSGRNSHPSHSPSTIGESTPPLPPPPLHPRRAFDDAVNADSNGAPDGDGGVVVASNGDVGEGFERGTVDDLLRPETAAAMKCACCFTPRSHNPADRYCHTCGTALPPLIDYSALKQQQQQRQQLQQHQSSRLNGPALASNWEDRRECPTCGMDNPPYAEACLVCEGELLGLEETVADETAVSEAVRAEAGITNPEATTSTTPPVAATSRDDDCLICPSCRKVSRVEGASFCNLCGLRLQSMTTLLQCRSCGRNNESCARFCFHCGRSLAGGGGGGVGQAQRQTHPPPESWTSSSSSSRLAAAVAATSQQAPHFSSSSSSKPAAATTSAATTSTATTTPPKLRTVGTQSLGLYFPSQAELQRRMEEAESKVKADLRWEQKTHHPLTMTSPGRGFWRKQMDHVCAHLRHYAARDVDFRCAAAQPRLGKILQTHLSEFRDTFSITLTFQRVDDGGPAAGGGRGGGASAAAAAAATSPWLKKQSAEAASSSDPNLASGRSSRFTSESTINLDSSRHFSGEEEESLFSTDETESAPSTPFAARRSRKSTTTSKFRKSYTFPRGGGGGGAGGSTRKSKSPRGGVARKPPTATAPKSSMPGGIGRRSASRSSSTTPSASQRRPKVALEIKGILMEVGAGGKGRRGVVENFVAEAEENAAGSVAAFATVKDGLSLLHVAAKNKRADCVAPLVFRGGGSGGGGGGVDDGEGEKERLIDVNVKTRGVGTSGNGPLHLAVMTGVDGLETVEALVDAGADVRQKNNKNLTPYDLAVKSGCDQMWTLLAAKEGQKMLRKLTKTTNNDKLAVQV